MIYYDNDGIRKLLRNIFRCRGSVFPKTFIIALPAALASSFLHYYFPDKSLTSGVLQETQAWSGFSFLVGFLIVFRTSQAYSRFWEGCTACHRMRAEWSNGVSTIAAFVKLSTASAEDSRNFKELLIRLCSMLHAAALAELEGGSEKDSDDLWAYSYEIIDPGAVDLESLQTISHCTLRTELLFSWIQQLITEQIPTGVLAVPAPILSRAYQELANGMVAFNDAMRISHVPFPFPYAQACDCVLMLHWLLVPVVTSQWVTNRYWAAVFCFIQVFILWSLNLIAMEIDHPFGRDLNDIDGDRMQTELNTQLTLLMSQDLARTPKLSDDLKDVNVVCGSDHRLTVSSKRSPHSSSMTSFKDMIDMDQARENVISGVAKRSWDRISGKFGSMISTKTGVIYESRQSGPRSSTHSSDSIGGLESCVDSTSSGAFVDSVGSEASRASNRDAGALQPSLQAKQSAPVSVSVSIGGVRKRVSIDPSRKFNTIGGYLLARAGTRGLDQDFGEESINPADIADQLCLLAKSDAIASDAYGQDHQWGDVDSTLVTRDRHSTPAIPEEENDIRFSPQTPQASPRSATGIAIATGVVTPASSPRPALQATAAHAHGRDSFHWSDSIVGRTSNTCLADI